MTTAKKATSKTSSNNSAGITVEDLKVHYDTCLLYTSPSPRDVEESRMPSSA